MSTHEEIEQGASVTVENIGGIGEATVSLEPGVNVLAGRNATNRTSFLQALIAAHGGSHVSVKGDADSGSVELELHGTVYKREVRQQGEEVSASGTPVLDDPELAELFAFLLESNEARRAVTTGRNLRDIIMRPVDLEQIKDNISTLGSEKQRIDDEIATIQERKRELPDLEAERSRLDDEISEIRSKLADKETEIEAADADVEAQKADQAELESKLAELRSARNDLEDIRYDIDTARESIQSLETDRTTLKTELDSLSATPDEEIDRLESEMEQLREVRRRLDSQISSLQSTVQFNEEVLEGNSSDIHDVLEVKDDTITAELLPNDEVTCWTCGSTVEREQISETLTHLRDLRQQKLSEKREIDDELDDLKADKQSLDQQRQRREQYQQQLSEVEAELEKRRERLTDLTDRRDDLEATVQSLEADIDQLESDHFAEVLELHQEANELEYELGRLETDRESVEAEIREIEQRLDDLSELEAEREDVVQELNELRTRVETLEKDAVENFNEHMDEVLGVLDYENLDRVWIERVQREVREGRRKNIKTFFKLHVVRSTASGTTYEDTIDHLSESEREVTGLVFALAGYLAHDVYEDVPFVLLDSLEAIDSNRIAMLVDYFAEFAEFLVVALLEEDAAAIEGEHNRIESI